VQFALRADFDAAVQQLPIHNQSTARTRNPDLTLALCSVDPTQSPVVQVFKELLGYALYQFNANLYGTGFYRFARVFFAGSAAYAPGTR